MAVILKLIFFLSIILIIGCSNSDTTDPIELVQQSTKVTSDISLADISKISVENSKGGLIINGSDVDETLSYTLSKTVKAESGDKAQAHFDDIELETETLNDSMKFFVKYPSDSDRLESYGYLDLDIPRGIPCTISNMREGIYSSYMSNTITVKNVKDHIKIVGHNGSCDLETEKGELEIEIAVPDSGFCKAVTLDGDIILKIPTETSAAISAVTESGTVTYENLVISNMNQEEGKLSGVLGSGSGEIIISTKNGNINITGI